MPKALDADLRAERQAQWADFTNEVLRLYRWNASQLAGRLRTSRSIVCRWRNRDPARGRLPSAIARAALKQLWEARVHTAGTTTPQAPAG